MRKTDTVDYMKNRIESAHKTEENISLAGKTARLVKKLFILAIVGVLVGPTLYQAVAPQFGIDLSPAAPDSAQIKVPRTGQDLAKAAQERETKDMQRQRQKQEEFDNLYESGERKNDL